MSIYLKEKAIEYKNKYNMNIIPVYGKKAGDNWTRWQNDKQNTNDLNTSWDNKVTGFGCICGINNYLCIDLDEVQNDKILYGMLDFLKISKNYEWIIKTKSGYHIWVKLNNRDKIFDYAGRKFAYKKYYPKEEGVIKHIELRVCNCYTLLPPSMHPDGGRYSFHNGEPSNEPNEIPPNDLIFMLKSLFRIVERETVVKQSNWEPDTRHLARVIKHVKKHRLVHGEWIDCCFALCSMGENGRKYFRELSINKFYPGDTIETIDNQYDQCLKRYKESGIKLNTLFYYAIELGYKYGSRKENMSKVMLTYPLSIMLCHNEILIERIICYGLIRFISKEINLNIGTKKINEEDIRTILEKHKIDFLTADKVIENFIEIEQDLVEYERLNERDAYGLVGLDLLIEIRNGKYCYGFLRTYLALRAILGRTNKMCWISIQGRLVYAYWGYKGREIYVNCLKKEKLPATKTIYRHSKRLKELNFVANFYYGRKTYYSTYYNDSTLKKMVKNEILNREKKKLINNDQRFRLEIKQARKKLHEAIIKKSFD